MGKLQAGDPAPPFTLPDTDGALVSLSEFAGQRVVVYFYPKDDTPGCTKEACQFNDALDDFEGVDIPVIGISPDPADSHLRFRQKYGLRFRLLSDPDKGVMAAYGAWGEKMNYGKVITGVIRSTFLIAEDATIARAWYSVKSDGHAARVLQEALARR
ncbi:MAG: thioredoxin-dependent thiol peroxidase [Acidimicrobiales bacterium]